MNYETAISGSDLLSTEEIQNRRKKRLIIAAIVLAVIMLIAFIAYKVVNSGEGTAGTAAATESQAQTLTVVAPGSDSVVRTISASGTLAARREVPVGVVGEGGRVTAVHTDAGNWVKKGQLLVSIDRSVQAQQAASLQAQIGVSQADLKLTQNQLDRALKLVDRGFISKADVDQRIAARDSARARLNVATAQYRQAQASNARLSVRAPVGGYVLERSVETGQTASAGSGPMFRIAQGGEIELLAQLSESDLAIVSQGVPATVTPVGSGRSFEGRIWKIAPTVNQQTRQGVARISLPFDVALKPGGFASVSIAAGTVTAPLLPDSAIQTDKSGVSFVYIIDKENKARRRNVKLGAVTAKGAPVLEGLSGNERVVLFAGGFLNEGESVNPKLQKPAK